MATKVLVVDDKEDTRELIRLLLEEEKFRVSVAANGREALQILSEEEIDIVLLDMMMPGMDGMEVFERIKKDEKNRSVPVVFLTAVELSEQEQEGLLAMGAKGCLLKPCTKKEILALIKSAGVEPT